MSIEKVVGLFPHMHWTGASSIHRSHASGTTLSVSDKKKAAYMVKHTKYGSIITEYIKTKVINGLGSNKNIEWLLNDDELRDLVVVDSVHHINGDPDVESRRKLSNPVTGNRFHRLALIDGVVLGVRFWFDEVVDGTYEAGLRIRFELYEPDQEEDIRASVEELRASLGHEIEIITEDLVDVAEPLKDEIHEFEQVAISL